MSDPILDVRDLSVDIPVERGTVHAVDGVSFTVRPGEALGLVGESGCGKTMTLRAIDGLLPRTARVVAGQVLFDGVNLVAADERTLRETRGGSIAMIFQDPMAALNPVMRVGDQIAEGPRNRSGLSRRQARAEAIELMRQVGIADASRRVEAYPHELSGGLRQRVMIAIALSCKPRLILCDEPTTALDVTIQDQILKLLLDLRASLALSIVLVTHDLAVVAETCDRLAVMYAGQIVETGSVAEVFREPRHPYTLGLLRSVPDLGAPRSSLGSISGRPPDLVSPPEGCRFHPRCALAQSDCEHGLFPLRPLAGARATACIHDQACADASLGAADAADG